MIRELFYLFLWMGMWTGLYHNLHTNYPIFKSYSKAVQNNIFSAIHSITSILFARYILYITHMSANDFLYKYSTSHESLLYNNITELENLTLTNRSTYGNMLQIYNHLIDTHSVTLISLEMMSICYFLYDIGYIVSNNLMFKKRFYLYHHALMILLHYYAYTSNNTYEYIWLFYYGELSNLFTYTTYHYMKTGNQRLVYISSLIQFLWFWYYRGLLFGSILIPFTFSIDSYLMRILLIPIYVMGIIWGIGLYKNVKRTLRVDGKEYLFLLDLLSGYINAFDAIVRFNKRILNFIHQNEHTSNPLTHENNEDNNENSNSDKLEETNGVSNTSTDIDSIDDRPNMPLSRMATSVLNSNQDPDHVGTTIVDPLENMIEDMEKIKTE